MSYFIANFTLKGNLTRDLQVRESGKDKEGKPRYAINMGVAVSNRVKDAQGNWADGEAKFYDITKFISASSLEHYQKSALKGSPIVTSGEIRQSTWIDPQTQKPKSRLDLICNELEFLLKPAKSETPAPATAPVADDVDIPF